MCVWSYKFSKGTASELLLHSTMGGMQLTTFKSHASCFYPLLAKINIVLSWILFILQILHFFRRYSRGFWLKTVKSMLKHLFAYLFLSQHTRFDHHTQGIQYIECFTLKHYTTFISGIYYLKLPSSFTGDTPHTLQRSEVSGINTSTLQLIWCTKCRLFSCVV